MGKISYRRRQLAAARRPGWWNQDKVLERLCSGETVAYIVDEAVRNAGFRVQVAALYEDIKAWRKEESFDAAWREGEQRRLPDGSFKKDWVDAFFQAMDEFDGNMLTACKAIGIRPHMPMSMLDPRNKGVYDEVFADRFRILESERLSRIREKFFRHAERGDGDPKVQEAILKSHLPHLHNPKTQVEVTGRIQQEHTMSPELLAAAQGRTRSLFGGRQHLLPAASEPIVLDITADMKMSANGATFVESGISMGHEEGQKPSLKMDT